MPSNENIAAYKNAAYPTLTTAAAVLDAIIADGLIGAPGYAPLPETPDEFTQTYSTADLTVAAATALDAPAGGTGATAGAYDTAAHRDELIDSHNALIADVLQLRKVVNAVIDVLQAAGLAD